MSCHSNVSTMTHLRTYLVRRLDGVDQDYQVDKKANGSDLLDRVSKQKIDRTEHLCIIHSFRLQATTRETVVNIHTYPPACFGYIKSK